jgi:hypothetical protein
MSRFLQGAIILAVSLYLTDLSLKATQRHAYDLSVAKQLACSNNAAEPCERISP